MPIGNAVGMPIGILISNRNSYRILLRFFCQGSDPGCSSNTRQELISLFNIFLMILVWQLGQPDEVKPKSTSHARM